MTNEQIEYLLKTPDTKPYIRFTHKLLHNKYTIAKFSIVSIKNLTDEIIIRRRYIYPNNSDAYNFYFIKLIWNDCDKPTKKRITNWFLMLAKHAVKVDISSLPEELATLFVLS